MGADELGDVFEGDVVGLAQRRKSIQVSGEAGATACNPTRYVYPVPGGSNGGPHAGYPAADIFKGNRRDGRGAGCRHGHPDRPRRRLVRRHRSATRERWAHRVDQGRRQCPPLPRPLPVDPPRRCPRRHGSCRSSARLDGGDGQGERLPHALRHQPTVPQSRMVGAQWCRRAAALSRRLAARHRHESEARCGFGGRSTRTPALIRA